MGEPPFYNHTTIFIIKTSRSSLLRLLQEAEPKSGELSEVSCPTLPVREFSEWADCLITKTRSMVHRGGIDLGLRPAPAAHRSQTPGKVTQLSGVIFFCKI